MTEPMTAERLAEIRRSITEIADYTADGLMADRREFKDRADLLGEVDRLRKGVHYVHYVHPFNLASGDPERQYCEADKEAWPCASRRLVFGETAPSEQP